MMSKTKRTSEKVIPIDTTEERFFQEYASILRPFMNAQIKGMMKREGKDKESDLLANIKKAGKHFYSLTEGDQLKIFAYLLYFNDRFSDMPEEERVIMINDFDIRARIRQKVYSGKVGNTAQKNTNYFVNYIQTLRDINCLLDLKTEGKKMINPLFEVFPEKKFRIIFEFNIKDRREEL